MYGTGMQQYENTCIPNKLVIAQIITCTVRISCNNERCCHLNTLCFIAFLKDYTKTKKSKLT